VVFLELLPAIRYISCVRYRYHKRMPLLSGLGRLGLIEDWFSLQDYKIQKAQNILLSYYFGF
jgi:hypothetical protein